MPDEAPDSSPDTRTLRAQAAALLSQAGGHIADIQRALGAAPSGSALHSRLAAAAAQTSAAIGALSQAASAPGSTLRQADLLALESVVFSGESAALVSEAATAQAGNTATTQSVAAASAATRQEVQTAAQDIFDKKILDPYLHFASPEDEAAYRQHEADAHHYVEQQLHKHTAQGDLDAGGAMEGQMLEADAHGAGESPEFLPHWKALVEKTEAQRTAMQAAGQSTEEYDRNMTASVRGFLKAKGLSETEIDQRLSASADPLEAVEPFIKNDRDSLSLERTTMVTTEAAHTLPTALPRVVANDDPSSPPAPLTIDLDAMNAKFKAAGVQMTEGAEPSGHGLNFAKPAARSAQGIGG